MVDEPVPEIAKPLMAFTDKILDKAIEDPLAALGNVDTLMEFTYKLMPTMPDEAPFPMPRGLFDKLKANGLPWQQNSNKK